MHALINSIAGIPLASLTSKRSTIWVTTSANPQSDKILSKDQIQSGPMCDNPI